MNKKILILLPLFIITIFFASAQEEINGFRQISGKVLDSKTKKPVAYASIVIMRTNSGTITNNDGEFTLKIPVKNEKDSLIIACLGYVNKILAIKELKNSKNIIRLKPAVINLSEIKVRPDDAATIVMEARAMIKHNYSNKPYMLTAFYRESIKRRRKYVAVSEAVIDAYKAPYNKYLENDRIRILKARKSTNYRKSDTLALKLRGGPFSLLNLDFVKSPGELLHRDIFDYYNYSLSGYSVVDNKLAYVISFEQKPEIDIPLYEGKFYIGVDDMSFIQADFRINQKLIGQASKYMVKKKPLGAEVNIEKAEYHTSYRYFNGKWYLSFVRNELVIFIRWKKKHFRSRYTTVAEMAVTDMDTVNIKKFRNQSKININDVFIEKVDSFEDPEFWGDYNIIHPEEPIQSAIKRMGRKLKRKQGR